VIAALAAVASIDIPAIKMSFVRIGPRTIRASVNDANDVVIAILLYPGGVRFPAEWGAP